MSDQENQETLMNKEKPLRRSKVGQLVSKVESQEKEADGILITIVYSNNNWESSEKITKTISKETTVEQLIEISVDEFKNKLYYDEMEGKEYNLMLFKKKTGKPNFEYPVCDLGTKICELFKDTFCLVEKYNAKKEIKYEVKKISNNFEINNFDRSSSKSQDEDPFIKPKGCMKGCYVF